MFIPGIFGWIHSSFEACSSSDTSEEFESTSGDGFELAWPCLFRLVAAFAKYLEATPDSDSVEESSGAELSASECSSRGVCGRDDDGLVGEYDKGSVCGPLSCSEMSCRSSSKSSRISLWPSDSWGIVDEAGKVSFKEGSS